MGKATGFPSKAPLDPFSGTCLISVHGITTVINRTYYPLGEWAAAKMLAGTNLKKNLNALHVELFVS